MSCDEGRETMTSGGKSIIVSMELVPSTAVPDLDIFVSSEFETLKYLVVESVNVRIICIEKRWEGNMRENDYAPD